MLADQVNGRNVYAKHKSASTNRLIANSERFLVKKFHIILKSVYS